MRPDNIDRIRTAYRDYYHHNIDSLPDGWCDLIMDFLHQMDGIGDLTDSVSIRFERTPSGLKAFVFPEMPRWTDEQMTTLRAAQRQLYLMSQQTCEVCGNPGAMEGNRVLCIGHAAGAAEKAKREQDLYDEVHLLFPPGHGDAISLTVPEHLFDLVATTLRAIHKIVVDEDIIGKVLITRVGIDGDALFVRTYYTTLTVEMGTQIMINELISDLETLSDELTRRQQNGGSDASA